MTTRLILAFLIVSIAPLTVIGYSALRSMERISALSSSECTAALTRLGEASIHQKALDVARQIELYLSARPELLSAPVEALVADADLESIAVQPVGETGYTAVYDREGVVHFHANPALIGVNMRDLSAALPDFWMIFEASLDGTPAADYYDWREPDGSTREKYMSCVPVGDTDLRVAATTYIDEFYRPIYTAEAEMSRNAASVRGQVVAALVVIGLGATAFGAWLAWSVSRPIDRLIRAAAALEQTAYHPDQLASEMTRRDDLGRMARVFDRVARVVQEREARLQCQISEMRIQVDEARRAREVSRITESEYFQQLQEQVREMRTRQSPTREE